MLPFGIHSAQEVFHERVQQSMDSIPNVETDIDDILMHGQTQDSHDKVLIRALDRCEAIGLTLNPSKCEFRVKEITYTLVISSVKKAFVLMVKRYEPY